MTFFGVDIHVIITYIYTNNTLCGLNDLIQVNSSNEDEYTIMDGSFKQHTLKIDENICYEKLHALVQGTLLASKVI